MKLALAGLLLAACGHAAPHGAAAVTVPPGPSHVMIDGVDIAYDVRGHGPVCLAHPGGPGFDSTYLRSPALEARFTVVYIDPVGTGASGKLPAGQRYSIQRDTAVLDQIRRHLGLGRVCLLGHSYGGFVVQRFALAHPELVSGLILYSTTPTTNDAWSAQVEANLATFKDQPWFDEALAGTRAESEAKTDDELKAALLREAPMFFADWTHRRDELVRVFATARLSLEVSTRREGEPFDVRPQLARLKVPTLVITGDRDLVSGPTVSGWIAQATPGATLVVIPDAGHFAHLEQPRAFAAAIDAFAPTVR